MRMQTFEPGQYIPFVIDGKFYRYMFMDNYIEAVDMTREDGSMVSITDNAEILVALGFTTRSEQEAFCDTAYGYRNEGGIFPSWKSGDYEAGWRVVDAIMKYTDDPESFENSLKESYEHWQDV